MGGGCIIGDELQGPACAVSRSHVSCCLHAGDGESELKMPMNRIEFVYEPRKFRGRGNRGRGNFIGRGMKVQAFFGREKFLNKPMNGIVPMRRGMGRMHPYMDPRGRGGMRGRPPGFMPPPPPLPPREMGDPFHPLPSPPPFAPLRRGHPPPPPPGLMRFRGRPPPPRGRNMLPPPRGNFSHPRGFPNGRGAAAHPPPPGRGQRWPAPPGGRRF
ncbi:uncharacterized protein LOC143804342 isoform X2 [Ranitomeya variabilis]|uniref:uncharacterized protein LOC143804342 isoform X2 n=2 Tax=Ranitomeya variabilis TaxID=490064 RepID=UPI004055E7BF